MTPDTTPSAPPAIDAGVEHLVAFLRFLDETRLALRKDKVSDNHADVRRIRNAIEEHGEDDRGEPTKYITMESAIYEDAAAVVTLWPRFKKRTRNELARFRKLVALELAGLRGDKSPTAILGVSILGLAALVVASIAALAGVIKTVTGQDYSEWLSEVLQLAGDGVANRVEGVLFIVGLFLVLWFVIRSRRQTKQIAFLAKLGRALDVYLDTPD